MLGQFLALALVAVADEPVIPDTGDPYDGGIHIMNLRADEGTAGACSGDNVSVSATVVLTWNVTPIGLIDSEYDIRIYQDGVLQETLAFDRTTWTKTVTGYVTNGSKPSYSVDWRFQARVVHTSSGRVVSISETTWRNVYGGCA